MSLKRSKLIKKHGEDFMNLVSYAKGRNTKTYLFKLYKSKLLFLYRRKELDPFFDFNLTKHKFLSIVFRDRVKFNTFKLFSNISGRSKSKEVRKRETAYSQNLNLRRRIYYFFNKLNLKVLRKFIKKGRSGRSNQLLLFSRIIEGRLDSFLIRCGFFKNRFDIYNFLIKKNVYVNGFLVTYSNHLLKKGDIISFNNDILASLKKDYYDKIMKTRLFNGPSFYQFINYRTFEIQYISDYLDEKNVQYPFEVNINQIFNLDKKSTT